MTAERWLDAATSTARQAPHGSRDRGLHADVAAELHDAAAALR